MTQFATLVALAALASISAFAQSSVELYGGLDTGIAKLKSDTGASTTNRTYTGGNAGYTSRLGVRGTEDLGGGKKATFNWEAALSSLGADATNNGPFSNSNANGVRTAQIAWVSPTAGTVTAGYGMNARHVMAATVAQNDFSLPGNIALGASQGGNGTKFGTTGDGLSNADYTLRSNAVAYTTPSMGGLNLVAGLVLANNNVVKNETAAQTTNANANAKVIGGIYANGPLTLLASTTKTTIDGAVAAAAKNGVCVDTTSLDSATKKCADTNSQVLAAYIPAVVNSPATKTNNIVGGMYDLGVAKIGFANYKDKLVNDNATQAASATAGDVNNRGNVISARGVVSGNYEAFALYSKGKYQMGSGGVDRAQSGYQLAGYYNFSKRTAAYVAYGVQKRENATAGSPETKDTMSTVGIRHNF